MSHLSVCCHKIELNQRTGTSYSKLTMLLVNETLKFTLLVNETLKFLTYYYMQKHNDYCRKNVRSFCIAKASHSYSAKNITTINFMSSVRLN